MQQTEMAEASAPEQIPGLVVILRAAIRPLVTLALTGTFIFMLLTGVSSNSESCKDMLTVLLAVYGPIVGFWFGQQAAQKQKQ